LYPSQATTGPPPGHYQATNGSLPGATLLAVATTRSLPGLAVATIPYSRELDKEWRQNCDSTFWESAGVQSKCSSV